MPYNSLPSTITIQSPLIPILSFNESLFCFSTQVLLRSCVGSWVHFVASVITVETALSPFLVLSTTFPVTDMALSIRPVISWVFSCTDLTAESTLEATLFWVLIIGSSNWLIWFEVLFEACSRTPDTALMPDLLEASMDSNCCSACRIGLGARGFRLWGSNWYPCTITTMATPKSM